MRIWIWIALTAACGPMYLAPAAPPPPSEPVVEDLADSSQDPPMSTETETSGAAPFEPAGYAGETPPRTRGSRGGPRDEASQWVDAHNRLRGKQCAAPLTWSAKLAEVAQRWANALRDRGCVFGHSGGQFGENLAAGTIGSLDPSSVVQMWYDEIAQYRFPDGGFSMKTGHFTQVVWRGSKRVGCGRSQCKGMDILVCEYDPAGNWEGQYRENVLPRGCR